MRRFGLYYNPNTRTGRDNGRANADGSDGNGINYGSLFGNYIPYGYVYLTPGANNKWTMTLSNNFFTAARPDVTQSGDLQDPLISPRYNNRLTNSDSNSIILTLDPNDSDPNLRIKYTSNPTVEYATPPNRAGSIESNASTQPTISEIGPWEFTLPADAYIIYLRRYTSNNVRYMDGSIIREPNYDKILTKLALMGLWTDDFSKPIALNISKPLPPRNVTVYLSSYLEAEVEVNFDPPIHTGAAEITHYLIYANAVGGRYRLEHTVLLSEYNKNDNTGLGFIKNRPYPGALTVGMRGFRDRDSYTFNVFAVNKYGYGNEYGVSDYLKPIIPVGLPSAPTLSITSDGKGGVNATLTPKDVIDRQDFIRTINIYSSDGGPSYTFTSDPRGWGLLTVGITTVNLTGFIAGKTYNFYATVTSATATSAPAVVYDFNPSAPAPPTGIFVENHGSNAIIRFNPSPSTGIAAATDYMLSYGVIGSSNPYVTPVISPATVSNLDSTINYEFRIKAKNNSTGLPSSLVRAPSAPRNVRAVGRNTEGAATVYFDPPADTGSGSIINYRVYATGRFITGALFAPIQDAYGFLVGLVGSATWPPSSASSPVEINNLIPNETYTFMVVAENKDGSSMLSSASNSITTIGRPAAPNAVIATAGDRSVRIDFTPGGQIDQYRLYKSTRQNIMDDSYVTITPGSPYIYNGLNNNNVYYFGVTSVFNGYESYITYSNPATPRGPLSSMKVTSVATSNTAC